MEERNTTTETDKQSAIRPAPHRIRHMDAAETAHGLTQSGPAARKAWPSPPSNVMNNDVSTLSLIVLDGLRPPYGLPDGNYRILSQNWISFKILGLKIAPFELGALCEFLELFLARYVIRKFLLTRPLEVLFPRVQK